MPAIGETRSANGETRQWDGSGWVLSQPESTNDNGGGAFGRFISGAAKTTPFNPMNLAHAVAHPIDTIGHAVGDPIGELGNAASSARDVVIGGDPEHPIRDRGISLLETLKHLGGAVPLIGKAGIDAGTKIGEGDIAGGAGELTGLASSALLPEAANRAPEAVRSTGRGVAKVGRGMETAGDALGGSKFSVGGMTVPGMGVAEALFRGDPKGLALAASPYALKYGGKGMQAAGDMIERSPEAMESLTGTLRGQAQRFQFEKPPYPLTLDELSPSNPIKSYGKSKEVPYRAGSGVSDSYSELTPRLDVRAESWPSNEPVFGDVRPELADVDMARDALAKGWSPENVRRVIMESPSLQSLRGK